LRQNDEIIRRTWQELGPELAEQGFELVEVEFEGTGARRTLRLYIDRADGVTVDHCATVSHLVSPLLDVKDFIDGAYMLEVSSPGIARPLRKSEDFTRFAGERVKVKTYEPVQGRKRFSGILLGLRDGLVELDCGGTPCSVHLENLKKANLDR